MTESEIVKMCVTLCPCLAFALVTLVVGVTEWIKTRNSIDLSKTKEGKKLLAYMIGEESQ